MKQWTGEPQSRSALSNRGDTINEELVTEILALIQEKPEYKDILNRILDLHEANPLWQQAKALAEKYPGMYAISDNPRDYYTWWPENIVSAWEQDDYPLGVIGNRLIRMGILKKWGSNKHKEFGLACPDDVKEALRQINEKRVKVQEVQNSPLKIPNDLFAPIVGLDDVKKLLMMVIGAPKPVHAILRGPAATAKSVFLMLIEDLEGAVAIEGTTSSKVGINETLLDEKPKILIIDEIGNLKPQDQQVLLELTGKGTASVTKHGRKEKEILDTRVIGACNRLNSTPEFKSRFEIVDISPYTRDEFITVCTNVLVMREGLEEDIGKYIAESVWEFDDHYRDVREAIRISRMAGDDKDQIEWFIKWKKANMKKAMKNW